MRVSNIITYTSSFRNPLRLILLSIRHLRDFLIFGKNNSRATNILIPFMNNYLKDYLNCKRTLRASKPRKQGLRGPFHPPSPSDAENPRRRAQVADFGDSRPKQTDRRSQYPLRGRVDARSIQILRRTRGKTASNSERINDRRRNLPPQPPCCRIRICRTLPERTVFRLRVRAERKPRGRGFHSKPFPLAGAF